MDAGDKFDNTSHTHVSKLESVTTPRGRTKLPTCQNYSVTKTRGHTKLPTCSLISGHLHGGGVESDIPAHQVPTGRLFGLLADAASSHGESRPHKSFPLFAGEGRGSGLGLAGRHGPTGLRLRLYQTASNAKVSKVGLLIEGLSIENCCSTSEGQRFKSDCSISGIRSSEN